MEKLAECSALVGSTHGGAVTLLNSTTLATMLMLAGDHYCGLVTNLVAASACRYFAKRKSFFVWSQYDSMCCCTDLKIQKNN